MDLNPLVETREWLQSSPWMWNGLRFLGEHAQQLMAAAICWMVGLMIFRVRRDGVPTAPTPAGPVDLVDSTPSEP